MCGIAGSLALDGRPPDMAGVRSMAAALAHRGPDGEGFLEDGPVALGHRRLSILDLTEAGRQPMEDGSGRYAVTYNGEIYNYLELRADLEADGVDFRSGSDTEVLLEGYARWGEAVLPRLNGMFAFAIWDRKERTLFCARDRFGEKPLFYRFEPGREFRFASEIKALVPPGRARARPDGDALFRFLAFGYCGSTDATFFEGIRQVPPSHSLRVRDGRLEVRRYWEPPAADGPGDEGAWVEGVAALLQDSVRIRLRSDVPVGTSLSGGLDSSAIVGSVARFLAGGGAGATTRRAAFSAVFPGAAMDETTHADAVVAATGAEPHRVTPSGEECLRDLEALVRAQEEPFAGPSIYAQWRVMGLARDAGVVVLLDGQGADEVFAGYHFYFQDHWWALLRGGHAMALRREMKAYDADHGAGKARRILHAALRSRSPRWLGRLKGGPDLPWLSKDLVRRAFRPLPGRPADLRGSLLESRERRMLPHLLRFADRNSMAFSREVRLPFLDHRLVEFVESLPDAARLRGGTTKWVLREAVRGIVPEPVRLRRDKVGFEVPFVQWMRGPLDGLLREVLASNRFRDRGLYDLPFLRDARERMLAGEERWAGVLWNCMVAEMWMRAFVDGPG